jgi:uncharacterized membrane protein
LRHTPEEQLLIVAWFGEGRSDTAAVNLHIPLHALITIGLTPNYSYKLTPLFHFDKEIIMSAEHELTVNFTNFTYEIYCFSKK